MLVNLADRPRKQSNSHLDDQIPAEPTHRYNEKCIFHSEKVCNLFLFFSNVSFFYFFFKNYIGAESTIITCSSASPDSGATRLHCNRRSRDDVAVAGSVSSTIWPPTTLKTCERRKSHHASGKHTSSTSKPKNMKMKNNFLFQFQRKNNL